MAGKRSHPSIPGRRITRRQFIHLAALAGAAVGAAACVPPAAEPAAPAAASSTPFSPAPSALPLPTAAPSPIAGPLPTVAPSALPTVTAAPATVPPSATAPLTAADIVKVYPAAPSVVVRTHHAGVWSGKDLAPAVLRQMLDASITRLTGLNDARGAWAALFRPDERIAIKVNTIYGSSIFTHVPLVTAVVDSLVDAGIPAKQVTIYDRTRSELTHAGFKPNREGTGPRCLATDELSHGYVGSYKIAGRINARLTSLLDNCDALINMPILKQHGMSGFSFALKNHFGTCDNPAALHGDMADTIPELNALPPIRQKTRLIVGDVLSYTLQDSWSTFKLGDAICMSFDPVAHDTVGLQTFVDLKKAAGEKPDAHVARANGWLKNAAKLGLGTNELQNIRLEEIKLA
ncbi:MAG TPA: DUF362 domain-containing protein [Anaerolineae bacterium]